MPRVISCLYGRLELTVKDAIEVRRNARRSSERPRFECKACCWRLIPHKASLRNAAHFEHLPKNPACPLWNLRA